MASAKALAGRLDQAASAARPQCAEPRFGLPLSLSEALDLEGSHLARQLSELLRQDGVASAAERLGAAVAMASSMLVGVLIQPRLAQARAPSLQGVWTLAPDASAFDESMLGARPDTASLVVTRDDAESLSYSLVEFRGAVEVARGAYQVSWPSSPSAAGRVAARVNGAAVTVAGANRDASGGAVLTTGPVRGWRASIYIHTAGRDCVQIEHLMTGEGRSLLLEHLTFRRSARPMRPARPAPPP